MAIIRSLANGLPQFETGFLLNNTDTITWYVGFQFLFTTHKSVQPIYFMGYLIYANL